MIELFNNNLLLINENSINDHSNNIVISFNPDDKSKNIFVNNKLLNVFLHKIYRKALNGFYNFDIRIIKNENVESNYLALSYLTSIVEGINKLIKCNNLKYYFLPKIFVKNDSENDWSVIVKKSEMEIILSEKFFICEF